MQEEGRSPSVNPLILPLGSVFPIFLPHVLFQTFTDVSWCSVKQGQPEESSHHLLLHTLPEEQHNRAKHHFPAPLGHHSPLASSISEWCDVPTCSCYKDSLLLFNKVWSAEQPNEWRQQHHSLLSFPEHPKPCKPVCKGSKEMGNVTDFCGVWKMISFSTSVAWARVWCR